MVFMFSPRCSRLLGYNKVLVWGRFRFKDKRTRSFWRLGMREVVEGEGGTQTTAIKSSCIVRLYSTRPRHPNRLTTNASCPDGAEQGHGGGLRCVKRLRHSMYHQPFLTPILFKYPPPAKYCRMPWRSLLRCFHAQPSLRTLTEDH